MTELEEITREIEAGLAAMRREAGFDSLVTGYLTTIFVLSIFAFTLIAAVVATKMLP